MLEGTDTGCVSRSLGADSGEARPQDHFYNHPSEPGGQDYHVDR